MAAVVNLAHEYHGFDYGRSNLGRCQVKKSDWLKLKGSFAEERKKEEGWIQKRKWPGREVI